ncbi:hypothetical protein GGX14DRAFT_559395 [Mycena pura]|uniref:Uncharacterized protein n=1 Tax=Mycena pura TaxID=153505 RepID=A0AAD6YHN8_9AGAR|nr:hypothetical protein GGX14DRAFT_559395 [Mycena pura]
MTPARLQLPEQDTVGDALSASISLVSSVKGTVDMLQLTWLSPPVAAVLLILQTVQKLRDSKQACVWLAQRAANLVVLLVERSKTWIDPPSEFLDIALLQNTLISIQKFMEDLAKRKWYAHIIHQGTIRGALRQLDVELDDARQAFQISIMTDLRLSSSITSSSSGSTRDRFGIQMVHHDEILLKREIRGFKNKSSLSFEAAWSGKAVIVKQYVGKAPVREKNLLGDMAWQRETWHVNLPKVIGRSFPTGSPPFVVMPCTVDIMTFFAPVIKQRSIPELIVLLLRMMRDLSSGGSYLMTAMDLTCPRSLTRSDNIRIDPEGRFIIGYEMADSDGRGNYSAVRHIARDGPWNLALADWQWHLPLAVHAEDLALAKTIFSAHFWAENTVETLQDVSWLDENSSVELTFPTLMQLWPIELTLPPCAVLPQPGDIGYFAADRQFVNLSSVLPAADLVVEHSDGPPKVYVGKCEVTRLADELSKCVFPRQQKCTVWLGNIINRIRTSSAWSYLQDNAATLAAKHSLSPSQVVLVTHAFEDFGWVNLWPKNDPATSKEVDVLKGDRTASWTEAQLVASRDMLAPWYWTFRSTANPAYSCEGQSPPLLPGKSGNCDFGDEFIWRVQKPCEMGYYVQLGVCPPLDAPELHGS